MMEALLTLDGNILLFIQEAIRSPVLDPVMKVITSLGNAGILWILLTVLLLIPKQTRRVGMISALALLASLLVSNILIKNLVARTRPYNAIAALIPIVPKPSEFSFPSGHTASSFASATVFYRKLPKKYGIRHDHGRVDRPFPALCGGTLSNRCAGRNHKRNRMQLSGRVVVYPH